MYMYRTHYIRQSSSRRKQ